jgi:hypothetical protein
MPDEVDIGGAVAAVVSEQREFDVEPLTSSPRPR